MSNLVRWLGLLEFLVVASGGFAASAVAQQGAPPRVGRVSSASAERPEKDDDGFRIVDPVVCRDVKGYEDFEELPGAETTSDEKLLVYYRPMGFKVVNRDDKFAAHFTQTGQVRSLGQKKVLLRKEKLLDYEVEGDSPPEFIYIRNTFSLKGLPPGDYEYDVILTDANADEDADDSTVTESVKFRIVPAKLPAARPRARPRGRR